MLRFEVSIIYLCLLFHKFFKNIFFIKPMIVFNNLANLNAYKSEHLVQPFSLTAQYNLRRTFCTMFEYFSYVKTVSSAYITK